MVSHEQRVQRHVPLHGLPAFRRLHGFLRQPPDGYFPAGKRTEPLLRQPDRLFPRDVSGDGKHGVVRRIKAEEELFHLVQRSVGDVRKFLPDSRPTVRMHLVGERAKQMSHITIRLVQATLLELLHHHGTLHLQTLFAERQFQHTVGLQPEANLHIRFGNRQVVVGNVVVRPCVVFASRPLQRSVIIGDMHRTAEHQMLEQMGKACMFGMLVTRPDVIDDVQGNHLRAAVFVVDQTQTVFQCLLVYLHMVRW